MTLEDFEKSLLEDKQKAEGSRRSSHRKHRDREYGHSHHHSHRRNEDDEGHRHKRRRHSNDEDGDREHRKRRHSPSEDRHKEHRHRHRSSERHKSRRDDVEEMTEDPPADLEHPRSLKRDSWMEAPSAMDVEYVRKKAENKVEMPTKDIKGKFEQELHKSELARQLEEDFDEDLVEQVAEEPATHEVDYTFGDEGSEWRMKKLKNVYKQAKESGKSIEDVALKQYGDLRSFDDAREEEVEVERRRTYGDGYIGKEKPSGELFQERKLGMGIHRTKTETVETPEAVTGDYDTNEPSAKPAVDPTALNRLKAKMMKAKLRGAPEAAQLEAEYNEAMANAAPASEANVVVLNTMQNRMLASGRGTEVKAIDNKRGRERGLVEENEDMSIEDMLREERRTRGQAGGEGLLLAQRIAKDGKFSVSLLFVFFFVCFSLLI
jgi:hypothetical protein